MKRCTKCSIEKPEDAFELQPSRGLLRSECRDCRRISNREWQKRRQSNPPQDQPETKQCNRCHEIKPIREFSPNGSGYFRARCRTCESKKHQAKREERRIREGRTWYRPFTNEQGILVRNCSKCRVEKPVSDFYWINSKRIRSRCKECEKEAQNAYNAANLEKRRAQRRASARRNAAKSALWRANHREYLSQYHKRYAREYRITHHERLLAHDRLRNQREERKQNLKKRWNIRYQKNPQKHIDRINRYRARKANVSRVERIDRQAIIERDKWTCYLCLQICTPLNVTLDHVIPLFHGGTHTHDNLRVACRSCNASKGPKLLRDFLQ